ncbi:MAG: 1-deoxy-D-xylulose-5-phosphate synthase [Candidatus Cloacimonetes bacterium]|jgi:1-deoxy-D-xylulose-5-phosphate synthase|nr:1-deoxy-D-xylulose-5-phosphate synthase [Candidatus Cloacimonadota bacterium]MCB5286519.1 1-deoxy-D-xylulose-5-phosphate synthase [Candidatus Cloacimonadota bacterium]MCK9185143.1 1-deoxy-D-xylulose-5-phosphate synthase [Candidatus Cloacimonadota bacterium]MCK9584280.1 1-deoxy-D-xylulose-5-phosphate synthase [Candidatus Cloacimonadota bacterium]MDY0228841.1 1-deoxy-D-xylulose-5-phosphate synthase [Candidatus Cloacimonadaceae bacterium]
MILEKLTLPDDIKGLSNEALYTLADEVRTRIIDVVAKNGGHIAPSLGAVDFTLALLNVFDPLSDRITWDVGHQSYAWKILTDRNSRFDTLRQLGGISGFTNRDESPYDPFSTGHSSTSISAALGIAAARDLKSEQGHCIAVIGDGALTGGMSFEALNHAGHLQPNNFIVVLNDNTMSISKNVGGLQKYMAHMYASKHYNTLKQQIWDLSSSLPSSVRRRFIYGARKLEESMMNILVPNIIFEDLGFKYVGPIDGHDIPQLISIFKRVKNFMVGPVLIHVVTQKGKGYTPAEKDSASFHGVGPFATKKSKTACKEGISYSEVFGQTLCELAEQNPDIVAITAAMSAGTGLSGFEQRFPERFFDVGIAEQHAITLAAGMTTKGIKPFVAIYSTFTQRALDQIIHDVALPKLPIVLCLDRAGIVGEDGATHQGAFDLAYLSFIPNLVILAPSCAEELRAMLAWAALYKKGPVAIRYPRGKAVCRQIRLDSFELGKAEIINAEADISQPTVAFVAVGDALQTAQDTAELLAEAGIRPLIVNLRSIKPLDEKTILALCKACKYIFSFENGSIISGVGARMAQLGCGHKAQVINFGYPDEFIPHGATPLLKQQIGFEPQNLASLVLKRL